MNYTVKPYDPLEEAIQRFQEFNQTPQEQRDLTEDELIRLVAHQVNSTE